MSVPKIVLSFDDGRADNYRAIKDILEPMNIPITLNVTTAYIDGTILTEDAPCKNKAMSKEQIEEISRYSLFEIAGHGDRHKNTLDDIDAGLHKLNKWTGLDVHGIASPNSAMTQEKAIALLKDLQIRGIYYIRLGILSNSFRKKIMRKAAYLTHSCNLFTNVYKDCCINLEKSNICYSVPIMHKTTCQQVIDLVEYAEKHNKCLILMFHSILKPRESYYEDTWSWDYDNFCKLCRFLQKEQQKGQIVISKTRDLFER